MFFFFSNDILKGFQGTPNALEHFFLKKKTFEIMENLKYLEVIDFDYTDFLSAELRNSIAVESQT